MLASVAGASRPSRLRLKSAPRSGIYASWMPIGFRWLWPVLLLLALAGPVPRVFAQYDVPGSASNVFSSAGDSSVQSRYNKAKKGANINEWVKRLSDDDPDKRLEAVKSLGDSNDPKAIDYLIQ